jgi:hypothetical protein
MKCVHCNEKTKVIDTRNNESSKAKVWVLKNIPFLREKKEIAWRWRHRICASCKKISYSIECDAKDFKSLLEDAKKWQEK